MLYRRLGFPEDGELVLCTVTKVQSHSVFVRLDEFDKGGMIHISEVSPGRIRNIRDFVIEDKIILDLKAKRIVTKEDYYQMKRYLAVSNKKLGLIVNFRQKYISPKRILN